MDKIPMKRSPNLPEMTPELVCYLSDQQPYWSALYQEGEKERKREFYVIHNEVCKKWRMENKEYISQYLKNKRRKNNKKYIWYE